MTRPMTLAAARVDVGMTQKDVAEAMNVTVNTIVAWESGQSEPKATQALKLCEIYRRPMNEIFFAREIQLN